MTSRITYSTTSVTGQQITGFIEEVNATLAKARRLKAKLDSMSYASDWTALEAEIGGMVSGTGQTLWTILATAISQMDSAQVAELERLDR